ncbi:peptidase M50B-like-domain-containing protein [Phakopsora pachyrhizi]|nr:peptidase M50B-like-domain-containing protein [Phakopsora pachyrhizi]
MPALLTEALVHHLEPRSVASTLTPNSTQRVTLYVLAGYIAFIFLAWNLWGLRHLIYPFKLLTVAFHEFSHAAVGCCTGAKIESITLDPNEGGLTKMRGGIAACTLPAGYLGSSLIGALLIFAGFDIVASKVASIILAVMLLVTLWWARNWLTRVVVFCAIGLMVAFWFIDHGNPLRFYVLFNGVMSCLYSVWDIIDDLIFRKINESDASQFAKLCPLIPSRVWGIIWLLISIVFMVGGILAGIAAFKDDPTQQEAASKGISSHQYI